MDQARETVPLQTQQKLTVTHLLHNPAQVQLHHGNSVGSVTPIGEGSNLSLSWPTSFDVVTRMLGEPAGFIVH